MIRGVLRSKLLDQLTVILPQSKNKQPEEIIELLDQIPNLVEHPERDDMPLSEASALCNEDLLSNVQSMLVFAYHDSSTILEATDLAYSMNLMVTIFYLD